MEMQIIIEMLAKIEADKKTDKEEMMEKMDANQAKEDKTLKERLAKWETEREADVEDLKSMMERMMDTDQT
jgi:hypothetical protein